MNIRNFLWATVGLMASSYTVITTLSDPYSNTAKEIGLKEAFEQKFHVGTALNANQILGGDPRSLNVAVNNFNAIVAENCMKSGLIQPKEGQFQFDLADKFVAFGEQHDMLINGHTLIWHSQAPKWFFIDNQGRDVSKEILIQRMKDHIYTVVGRYKGRVHTWDVVNEAILEDGSWRKSKFYEIIGEEFVALAFQFTHEADPDAELYYNDYSMANPGKRQGVIDMVKELQQQGIKIDGIGMQGHVGLRYPDIADFEASIKAFSDLGVDVMITELDINVLPSPWENAGADVSANFEYTNKMNPYADGLPDSVQQELTVRYLQFFELFDNYQEDITRVTLWGVNDGVSWLNNWPIRGRTNYPLLFDRDNNAKPAAEAIIARYYER